MVPGASITIRVEGPRCRTGETEGHSCHMRMLEIEKYGLQQPASVKSHLAALKPNANPTSGPIGQ